jgi:DNA-binding transcriptional regulator YbjK
MSNNYWEDEDEDQDNDIPLQGDDLVKKLRKAKRADEKRIKELTEQLENLSKVQRERTVKEVLEKKGVNLKAARLVLKDLDDVSEEAVNNWLTDNADLFGINIPSQSNADDVSLAALRQQDIVTQGAVTPDREADFNSRIDNAQSAEELIALIQSQKQ